MNLQVQNIRLHERLAEHYTSISPVAISSLEIKFALFTLLADKEDLQAIVELSRIDLSFEEATALLNNFDFTQFKTSICIDASLLPEKFFPSGYASIRDGGLKWQIHLNDADPWPSRPHAHAYQKNYVLDLSNGNCYQRRKYKFTLPRKSLLAIREKFESAYEGALPGLAI